jgi:hypothetical protein
MKNLVSWVEIPAVDFSRAVKFYNAVLGLSMQELDFGQEKMACFPTGEGAIFQKEGYKPSKDGVIVSLNAGADLDGAIDRVKKNGGTIIIPKTKIEAEGRGYFATFTDTEGNILGLYGDN